MTAELKMNGTFNNLIAKTQKGKYLLEIGNDFLSGDKFGYGESFFEFYESAFVYDIITEKSFILFLKQLEKEVIKNESKNK